MKNLKKVLALVLAFATASTMMASAVVFDDIQPGTQYAEAITFLSDLGIITGKDDGKYHPEDTITRAEACALIARMMTGETSVSKWAGASAFTDVSASHWAESAIGYCFSNGIVKGYGDSVFKPDQQITDEEFVAMLTRAMGYDTPANPLSYPYGNLTKAQDEGLLYEVEIIPGSPAKRGEDAQMIYNAIFADYARSANFTNTTHASDDDAHTGYANTIASEVFGMGLYHVDDDADVAAVGADVVNGLKDCEAHTAVITGVECDEENTYHATFLKDKDNGTVSLDKEFTFKYEGDAEALIGYEVELWGDKAHTKENEVKAIKIVRDQTVYGFNSTVDTIDKDNKFEIEDTKLELAEKAMGETDRDVLNARNAFQYTMFDWDNNGKVDYISTMPVLYGEVINLSSKTMRLALTTGATISFDVDEDTIKVEDAGKDAIALVDSMLDFNKNDKCVAEVEVKNHEFVYEIPADVAEGDVIELAFPAHSYEKSVPVAMSIIEEETKSITGTDMKDGFTEFDDVLIKIADGTDARKDDTATQYFFDEKGSSYKTEHAYYVEANEDDDVMYDVRVDMNGYVISMVESDTAYTGYLYATGWLNGMNETGKRYNPIISYVNDANEYVEEAIVANDAEIVARAVISDNTVAAKNDDVYDKDVRELKATEEDDVVGRVFKYAMNEDGEITKLTEVANQLYSNPDDYTYTTKNDRLVVEAHNGNDWNTHAPVNYYMDDCDVIFAIRTNIAKKYDVTGADDVDATANDDNINIDPKDVMAVTADMIPDIAAGENTTPWGVRFSVGNEDTDRISSAVIGVNNFNFFQGTNVYVAIISELNEKKDYFEVEAYIPQMDEGAATYKTVDEGDFTFSDSYTNKKDNKTYYFAENMNAAIGVTNEKSVDAFIDYFESDSNDGMDKPPVYAEVTVDDEGLIMAIDLMEQVEGKNKDGKGNEIWTAQGAKYSVSRVIVEGGSKMPSSTVGKDYVNINDAVIKEIDGKTTYVDMINPADDYYVDVTDATIYAAIDDGKRYQVVGQDYVLFETDLQANDVDHIGAGDVDALESYLADADSEYVMCDVIIEGKTPAAFKDGADAVAMLYFDDIVKPYKQLKQDYYWIEDPTVATTDANYYKATNDKTELGKWTEADVSELNVEYTWYADNKFGTFDFSLDNDGVMDIASGESAIVFEDVTIKNASDKLTISGNTINTRTMTVALADDIDAGTYSFTVEYTVPYTVGTATSKESITVNVTVKPKVVTPNANAITIAANTTIASNGNITVLPTQQSPDSQQELARQALYASKASVTTSTAGAVALKLSANETHLVITNPNSDSAVTPKGDYAFAVDAGNYIYNLTFTFK